MSFEDDFGEISGDFDIFKSILKKSRREFDELLRGIKNGEMEGTWEIREIEEPGVKGYSIQGRFGSNGRSDPLEPLKPLKRRPLPENPFEIQKDALKETREPLVDIFEDENAIRIYVELPGEEEDHIKLGFAGDRLEIKAKNFHKLVELPKRLLAIESMSSEYRNGVLSIRISKRKDLRESDSEKAQLI